MKISKSLFLSISLLTLGSFASASNAEALLKTNCASCHMLTAPTLDMIPTLKAPPMDAVLFHVKDEFPKIEQQKAFIIEYVLNPVESKSVCESNKVSNFGVMPSLKGKISDKDLEVITDYIINTYPSKKFVSMIRKMKINNKLSSLKNSAFLINQDALPHLTKILIENWNKEKLGLTSEQKKKLLVVREDTLKRIKRIKKLLKVLEPEIIELTTDEDSKIKEISKKLERISTLKSEATMTQIKCLRESVQILNEKQLELLLPFWDS